MRLLLLLLLTQNLNQQPIESRQAGARLSPFRQYAVDCRTGMTCAVDGGTLYLSSSGGGSTPTVTCAADEALTWDGAAWGCISKIRAAWAADAGITAQYLTLTCAAGEFVTCDGSSCSCATPSGGGGSGGNFVSDTVTFSSSYDATKTVTAAWATAASKLVCAADGEEASVEGVSIVVISKAAGSFTVRAEPRAGRHTGDLPFTCTGL